MTPEQERIIQRVQVPPSYYPAVDDHDIGRTTPIPQIVPPKMILGLMGAKVVRRSKPDPIPGPATFHNKIQRRHIKIGRIISSLSVHRQSFGYDDPVAQIF
jgi:hypothetical protein